MNTTSIKSGGYKQPLRNPQTAALLSIIPGLGQFYNGETRKGLLFLLVTAMNTGVFIGIMFTEPLVMALMDFGKAFHMKLNPGLGRAIIDAHFGSAISFILIGLFLSFVVYAMRDAYDHAAYRLKRRRIYREYVIELPEATSGSYIVHFSVMVTLFIIAFFFIVPLPPPAQITDIEFIQNQPPTLKKIVAKRKAEHASENAGKHDPKKPVQAPSPAPKAQSKASQASRPAPAPTPSQSQPSPRPTPRPVSHASPQPTPTPRSMQAPSPMPRLAPSPMTTPSPTPQPKAAAKPAFNLFPSFTPSPSNLPKSGGPAPVPSARPSALPSGLPSVAPSPIAMGTSGSPGFAPMPKLGTSPGGGIFSSAPAPVAAGGGGGGPSGHPSPVPTVIGGGGSRSGGGSTSQGGGAPAPSRASSSRGGGGGSQGGPMGIAPSVPRPAGGGGGDNMRGNPDANNNPGGRPSVAAMADVDFGPYMADLQRRIKKCWFPPKGNETKRVVVVFKVHRAGELSHLRLEKSSGMAIADQAALRAVETAAPFRPLPTGAPDDVDIQFTFDYNVFGGGGRGVFRQF
jgi:TonB family protein